MAFEDFRINHPNDLWTRTERILCYSVLHSTSLVTDIRVSRNYLSGNNALIHRTNIYVTRNVLCQEYSGEWDQKKKKKRPLPSERVYTLVFGYWLLLLFSHKPIITASLNGDNISSSRCMAINGTTCKSFTTQLWMLILLLLMELKRLKDPQKD